MSHQVLRADQWPLFEIRVTRYQEQRQRLHFSIDFLIADSWSLQSLFQEWFQLYQTPEVSLAGLEISFRDYVLGEQALQNTELYQRSWDYWFSRIDTLPPAPELPLAMNPSAIRQPKFVRRSFQLERENWQQLKQRARQAGLTPSGVLVAAFAEVLTVWSKSPKFTINLTLFNRLPLHPQVNDIFGNFTSLSLLAVDNVAAKTFIARAISLSQQMWQDLDHRYVSAVQVLQRELSRRQGGTPRAAMPVVFTSTLGLGSFEQSASKFNQLGEVVYSISQTPQVWLENKVCEEDGVLVCHWDAVEELFPEGLLSDMFEAYNRFLMQLATCATWREATPQLVSEAQLRQRYAVNATSAPISGEMLHTLFAAQVLAHADDWAVISPQRSLTYLELSQLANQIGHRLRGLGACPNTLVAVVMESGWEQVVAVLGILMSGAAYMPIDPGLPTQRRWHLLEQGQVKLVVTLSIHRYNLEWPEGILRLEVDSEDLVGVDSTPLESVQSPEDLAYVIYTSGSTGLPKGVMIDHQGAVNTIKDINQRFGVGPSDRVLALSALNFDLSVYDIFGTLAAGGTVIIPEAGQTKDPAHMATLMVQHQVTIWNSVPALMQMLVEYVTLRPEKLPTSLRLALLSGDWLPLSLPDQIKALWSNVQLVSLGGATEASIWSICYPIETVDPDWKRIPYGKPLTNQSLHVLNELIEPCPVWVPGQLYIGGIGLALGYWQDPEKTGSSFIIHPDTGERLYKTGDLGRYLPSGDIEFLGREDFQVKVNGLRIELGEIEAGLVAHPDVREVVVIAQSDHRGDKRLVAYVVPNQQQVPSNSTLSCFLKQKLPDYMLPSAFVLVDNLPLTSNGKVNRHALPTVDWAKNQPKETFVAPRDQLELQLTSIWEKVLGIPSISVTDNFFALGGYSLLAARLFAQIEQTFGKNLPLSLLFQAPTVEQLASLLRQKGWSEPKSLLVPIQPSGSKPPLFCIPGAGGSVLSYRDLAHHLGADQPFYGLQLPKLGEKQANTITVEDLAAQYIKEIFTLQPEGPYLLAGHCIGGLIAFEMAQQLHAQGQKVSLLALFDAFVLNSIKPLSLGERLFGHFGKLLRLGPTYVLEKGKNSIPWIKSVAHVQQKDAEYIAYEQIGKKYTPQIYPGRVLLFQASNLDTLASWYKIDPQFGWGKLAGGGLETYVVPGDLHHIFKEPGVQVLAENLRAHLTPHG
jgi:amino acid adenylation domain-containing protein